MIRRPPYSPRTYTLFPVTTLVRSFRVKRDSRSLEPRIPDHESPFLGDRLGDVRRRFRVVVELHRERGAALRHRAQRGRVAEHLAQRQLRIDDLARRTVVLALQDAATTADVAHNVTEIVFGGADLDLHDRLGQTQDGPTSELQSL